MNKLNSNHIIFLKNNMIKYNFLILIVIFHNKEINYKNLNLIIYYFFNKTLRIHWIEYQEFFINSGYIEINKEKIYIKKDTSKIKINISDFKYEIMLLEELYSKYWNMDTIEVNKIYYKIF